MLAIVGVLLAVVADLTRIPQAGLGYQAIVAALVAAAAIALLMTSLRSSYRLITKNVDILVPLGIVIGLQELIVQAAQMSLLSIFMEPATDFQVLRISVPVSMMALLSIVIWLGYGVWTLVLIVDLTRSGSVDIRGSLSKVRIHLLRVFLIMAITMIAFFLLLGLAIGLATTAMSFALFLIFIKALVFNFGTAALLLRAVAQPLESLGESILGGIRVSFANARRWWFPVLAQMEIVGLVCFLSYSSSNGFNNNSATNYSVNGKWTGGFESSSSWLSKAADISGTPEVSLLTTLLAIVLGVLAVAIKLHIAQGLKEAGELGPVS